MKSYLFLSSVSTRNSSLISAGKALVICARFVLLFTMSILLLTLIAAQFIRFEAGSLSGVPFGFGILFWLFFEFAGSVFIEIGKYLTPIKTPDESDSSLPDNSPSVARSHAVGFIIGKIFRGIVSCSKKRR